MIKKNIFSLLAALFIMYLSLTGSETFDKVPLFNIPNFDKIVHFGMYFSFMSVIILENRKSVSGTAKLFIIALIPFLFGVTMEILQKTLTTTRSGSIFDALANLTGILTSVLLWLWIRSYSNKSVK